MTVSLLRKGGPPTNLVTLDYPTATGDLVLNRDHKGLLVIPEAAVKSNDISTNLKRLLRYQQETFWHNDPPAHVPEQVGATTHLPDMLARISKQADIDFLADYHCMSGTMPTKVSEKKRPLQRTLKEELDYRAVEYDISWKQDSHSLYLLRDNRWYRDDPLQVPASLLKVWMTTWRKEKKEQEERAFFRDPVIKESEGQRLLRWGADIVSHLTAPQIAYGLNGYVDESGSSNFDPELHSFVAEKGRSFSAFVPPTDSYVWQPFATLCDFTLSHLNILRFYTHLDDPQKFALRQGNLAWTALSSDQQKQALPLMAPYLADLAESDPAQIRLAVEFTHNTWSEGRRGYVQNGNVMSISMQLTAKLVEKNN